MRLHLSFVLATLALVSACEVFTEPLGDLEIRLTAGAASVLPGDGVPLTVVVRNDGPFPIGLETGEGRGYGWYVGIELISPDGGTDRRSPFWRHNSGVPQIGDFGCSRALGRGELGPLDSIVVTCTWIGPELPPGAYRLRPFLASGERERRGPAVPMEIPPHARVRLVHALPGLPALDFAVGGRQTAVGVAAGAVSRVGWVSAGRHVAEVRRPGEDQPLHAAEFELRDGGSYTFAAWRPGPIQLLLLTHPDTLVAFDRSRFRFVHLADATGAVTVQFAPPEGPGLETQFGYGTAGPYAVTGPGWWRVLVTGGAGQDTLARWSVRLAGGQVRTLLMLRDTTGAFTGLLLDP